MQRVSKLQKKRQPASDCKDQIVSTANVFVRRGDSELNWYADSKEFWLCVTSKKALTRARQH